MFNFEDNIGLLVLKMIAWKKQCLFVKEFSILTTSNRVMGQDIQF